MPAYRRSVRRLQLRNCAPDPYPHKLPVAVAAFKHEVGAASRLDLGTGAMPAHEQIGGPPDVEFGHTGHAFTALLLRFQLLRVMEDDLRSPAI